MYDDWYTLDDEKDKDKINELIGHELLSRLDNYAFPMGTCAVCPGDLT